MKNVRVLLIIALLAVPVLGGEIPIGPCSGPDCPPPPCESCRQSSSITPPALLVQLLIKLLP